MQKEIKISGIIRPNPDAVNTSISNGIGYTKELMLYIIKEIEKTEIVKQQEADTTVDVFTGIPFDNDKDTPLTMDDVNAYVSSLPEQEQTQIADDIFDNVRRADS